MSPSEKARVAILNCIQKEYPETFRRVDPRTKLSSTVISPFVLHLPKSVLDQAQKIVSGLFTFRDHPVYPIETSWQDPKHNSVLMSYDFHLQNQNGEWVLRLIEINTNASQGMMGDLVYRARGIQPQPVADPREEIWRSFQDEFFAGTGQNARKGLGLIILDEKPNEQRLHIEFEMYREHFVREGWEAKIADIGDLKFSGDSVTAFAQPADLIYNRWTDFYLESPAAQPLREAVLAKRTCLTPHPFEYSRLADKSRMMDWTRAADAGLIPPELARHLIPTRSVAEFSPDDLWSHRKKFFFKPKNSHGGKATYRGANVSHPMFQNIIRGEFVAQEFVPAPELQGTLDAQVLNLKYDLRFICYQDRIQMALARFYQGQTTNAQTTGGGITPILWIATSESPYIKMV